MKRIDFYQQKRELHFEMLEAIVDLFKKAGIDEIELFENGECRYLCYAMYCPYGADSIRELRVSKVRCNERLVEVMFEDDEDNWVSCEHAGEIVTASIDEVYGAVYDYVSDLN